jgi:hypothetical protein
MPKRKEPELTKEEQFKRFVETARKHGVDESGKDLERAFKKVAPSKPAAGRPRRGDKPTSP